MNRKFDVVIVGAGPAGMSAAIKLRTFDLSVLVVDEQPEPGGKLWHRVESIAGTSLAHVLGKEYESGESVASLFRGSGATYEPNTQVWQIDPSLRVLLRRDGEVESVKAKEIIVATGALERPAPFPGWTLPGVMPVGGAQLLLKDSRQIPQGPTWVAGSGPLLILYMAQVIKVGGEIEGWLDTSAPGEWLRTLRWFKSVFKGRKDVLKGLLWLNQIKRSGTKRIRGVKSFHAYGEGRLHELEYTLANGLTKRVRANALLVHEGVVPSIHMTQSLGLKHHWSHQQSCLVPSLDSWGASSLAGISVAGDGAGIGGGQAACVRGEIVALGIAMRIGLLEQKSADALVSPLRKKLKNLLSIRPMLDALYPPPQRLIFPSDETVVCRCEEITVGDIRRVASMASPGINQLKAFTRAGMGPCQGRQCGYTIANIIATEQKRQVNENDFYRIRPPLKPITLGELVSLKIDEELDS
ncbi:FAD-dependent oxidoreductase [Celerinatantimonas sp. MCCC 1A17872]|uniref:FAD-dependent oxidoreductase n=1 Tax=Celerinatantimonas sp. MCCC 1A17872 TaxID=3177514 RepID=UPI0038C4EED1